MAALMVFRGGSFGLKYLTISSPKLLLSSIWMQSNKLVEFHQELDLMMVLKSVLLNQCRSLLGCHMMMNLLGKQVFVLEPPKV